MSNSTAHTTNDNRTNHAADRVNTETKASTKTTEFFAYVAAVLAIVVTAMVIGDDGQGGDDPFGASHALRYITFLTIGYMVARGLAKSGSREHYDAR